MVLLNFVLAVSLYTKSVVPKFYKITKHDLENFKIFPNNFYEIKIPKPFLICLKNCQILR